MKKFILALSMIMFVVSTHAKTKFQVKDFCQLKLHSYVTAYPLGDMSYIIEGRKSLVVLEPVPFRENIKEFREYITKLNKPVEKVIANYHAAGFSSFDHSRFVMIEGMPEFIQGDIYKSMMSSLKMTYKDIASEDNLSALATNLYK